MTMEPAREHPTSTTRSSPAASIIATTSARFENRDVLHLAAPEAREVVADDAVRGRERRPLRVPHARVGDPGVREHHARALARPLRPQAPALDRDEVLELRSLTPSAPAPGRRAARRPEAVRRRHRLEVATGVEDGDQLALGHIGEGVVLANTSPASLM